MLNQELRIFEKGYGRVFSASMPREVVTEIDMIRGDIPRSRWLCKAAIKELECHDARHIKRK